MEWDLGAQSAADVYRFMTSAVAPRPVAWVTTVDKLGPGAVVNAAPFSWYQSVCADPPMLMLALSDRKDDSPKDTLRNIEATKEFVVNVATRENAETLVATSAEFAPHASEVDRLGLETVPSAKVAPPRLAASPVHMECRLVETRKYGAKKGTTMIIGEIVWVAADDEVVEEGGRIDPAKVRFLARLGGRDYAAIEDVFPIERPKLDDDLRG